MLPAARPMLPTEGRCPRAAQNIYRQVAHRRPMPASGPEHTSIYLGTSLSSPITYYVLTHTKRTLDTRHAATKLQITPV